MRQCENCGAVVNGSWKTCLSCGEILASPYPVAIKMKSAILGPVPVKLWPDRAEVAGVQYSHAELKDFISRDLSTEGLRTIHSIKQTFDR